MRVGFAGLGRMGRHMAVNLAQAGHEVTVWNRSPGPAAQLADAIGVEVASSPSALARGAEVVVTMLADDAASQAVHTGDEGLFGAGAEGASTIIEMGTMSPGHIRELASSAPMGVRVLDAPVSGATPAARDATLMIMVGAAEAEIVALRPIFDAMGRKTICMGREGAGAIMKLAINSLIHGMNQTLAEAVTLSEAAGIAPEAAFDAIAASAAAAPMFNYRRGLYLDEAAHDVTFTIALAAKDMAVTTRLAEAHGTAMPQGQLNLDRLRAALDAGYGERDMAAMLNFMRETNR